MSKRPDTAPAPAEAVYSVHEVARLTGLSGWTLRYYEKIGLVDAIARDRSSGHRVYSARDLDRIESIAHLRAAGLSIDAMRALMRVGGHSPESLETKIELLTAHSAQIAREIEQLAARRRYIDNRAAYWRAVQSGDEAGAQRLMREGEVLRAELA